MPPEYDYEYDTGVSEDLPSPLPGGGDDDDFRTAYNPPDVPDYGHEGLKYAPGKELNPEKDSPWAVSSAGGFDLNKLLGSLKGLGSKTGEFLSTPSGLLTGLMGLYALSRLKQDSPSQYAGYKGSIPKLTATRTALPVPEYKPYSGQAVMGRQYFSPVTYAAEGGIMEGGEGRYLRGATDGMADEIPSSIDGEQPAKLSHGEFVIPADVVSHFGNGNSDAGAEVLYDMMDRVREARTGTTEQGKKIDPEKFFPGGIAGYSDGGAVAFQTGGGTGTAKVTPGADGTPVSQTNTLSPWVGDYVTGMLGQGQALAQMPYQPYMGPISAGYSPLQQQAFGAYENLQMPYQFDMASNIYGDAAQRAGSMFYQPTQFANQYQAPRPYQPSRISSNFQFQPSFSTQFSNQFQAPGAYQPATDITAGMGPQQYQSGQFQTGLGPVGSVQDYMNQYQQGVTDIAAREARRQSGIGGLGERAAAAKAGAFGGSRQAILEAERQRNLEQQLGDIQQKGLASAFDVAQKQRLAEAGMGLDAQRALEQSRQFGAGLTQQGLGQLLQARQAQEASRQFGAQQGMQAADLQARYGLSAEQAQEASRQFAEGQRLTAAQLQEQFGMDAQKAREMANQFAYQQRMQSAQLGAQYGTEAQRMAEQSRQYGADFGLRALQQQMAAAQGLGNIGGQQFGAQMQGLQGMLGAGGTQRDIEQQGIKASMDEYNRQMMWPYQQLQFQQSLLQGLPIGSTTAAGQTGAFGDIGRMLSGLGGIYGTLKGFGG